MGRGNPLINSFDCDKYNPDTYFLDFSEDFESYKKDFLEANELESVKDETIWNLMEESGFECCINLFEEFCSLKDNEFVFKYNKKEMIRFSELAAGYDEEGIVLAEGKHTLIVTTSEAQSNHFPFALIPNWKYEALVEDFWQALDTKWYDSRKMNFDEVCEEKAAKEYQRLLIYFKREERRFWQYFIDTFGQEAQEQILRHRAAPWTSGKTDREYLIRNFKLIEHKKSQVEENNLV